MRSTDPAVPCISIVVVARNGDTFATLRTFVESWTSQSAPLGLSSELIVLSVAGSPPIADVRIVEVPPDTLELTARNGGIRAARGEFILSTTPDIALSAPAPPDPDLVWLITQMRRLHTPAILNVPAYATGREE